jgi:A/G-specific adenine glycosylase
LQHDCVALRTGRVESLPTSKPGKPLPQRHVLVLLLQDREDRVLLQRRPPAGIWASLWSLPEADDHPAARTWFERHVCGNYDAGVARDAIAHGFTHYRLELAPLQWRGVTPSDRLRDNEDLRWADPKRLSDLGLPAPIRKLLEAL